MLCSVSACCEERASLRYSKKAFAVSVEQPLPWEMLDKVCRFSPKFYVCTTALSAEGKTNVFVFVFCNTHFHFKQRLCRIYYYKRSSSPKKLLVCIFNFWMGPFEKNLDNDILPGFIIESPPKPTRPISITDRHNCERNKSNSVGIKRYPHYKTYLPSLLF